MEKDRHFYYLDFVRFIAAIAVLLVHARCETFATYSDLTSSSQNVFVQMFFVIANMGLSAVCVFFLLSGFLTGGRIIDNFRNGKISSGKYVIGRFSRLYPPFIIALCLTIISNIITNTDFSWWMIAGNVFGLQGITCSSASPVFWTIPYELWFYVIIFSCLLLLERRTILGLTLLLLSSCMFISLKPEYFFILLAGILGYFIKDIKINKYIAVTCAVISFFCLILSFLSSESKAFVLPLSKILNKGVVLFCFSFFFVIVMSQISMCKPNRKWQIVMETIGKQCAPISYSLFLSHISVLYVLKWFRGGVYDSVNGFTLGVYVLNCLICVIVGWLLYWLIEKRTKYIQMLLLKLFRI